MEQQGSVATVILPQCKVVHEGEEKTQPTWYQLPIRVSHCDEELKVRKVEVGEPCELANSPKDKKVILLVGAIASGKSTLINALVNSVFGVNFEDPFRLQLVSEESVKVKGQPQLHSPTNYVTVYSIHWCPQMLVPFSMDIVDSPGYGDPHSFDKDVGITARLTEIFSHPSPLQISIHQLDCVGIVCPSTMSRLTEAQKYIFDSIYTMFGKDLADNISIMFTFSESGGGSTAVTPPALAAIQEYRIPYKHSFCFNNAPFTWSRPHQQQQQQQGPLSVPAAAPVVTAKWGKNFWTLSQTGFRQFLDQLKINKVNNLRMTREVLDMRYLIELLLQRMISKIDTNATKLNVIRQEFDTQTQFSKMVLDATNDKNKKPPVLKLQVTKTRKVELGDNEPSRYILTCLACGTMCHVNCVHTAEEGHERTVNCATMENRGQEDMAVCGVCVEKCSWQEHAHRRYYYEECVEWEQKTLDQLKDKYNKLTRSEFSKAEKGIAVLLRDYMKIQAEVTSNLERMLEYYERLAEIALRPEPVSKVAYLDSLVKFNEREKLPGWKEREAALQKAKERAALIKEMYTVGASYNPFTKLENDILSDKCAHIKKVYGSVHV